ncbi:glycosyl hydrolase family 18 protein [Paenisporosarcina sp. TG20]|uniref:glycosyl hydrolase family 18 protein n=1 Tax=Paenisporosarcina sp. TG20 TaxID=1211706 RepID=UPI000307B511|nr:glycosyl hydrolase family 18 protein [Paenisporosarcina sp. TG20]
MIYVVKTGDSLFSIAKKFETTAARLAMANELEDPDVLVVGQTLVIPGTPNPNRPTIETNAYVEWYTEKPSQSLLNEVKKRAPLLTYMMPFSYDVRADGSLSELEWNGLEQIAVEGNMVAAIVISNIEEGAFSDTLAQKIFASQEVQDTLIENILAEAKEKNAKDIHVDFEYLRKEDRLAYVEFLRRLKEEAEGLIVSAALAPKTSATQVGKWYEGHDYNKIAEVVDFVVIMTYEWGYSGGPAMAVSPIGPVRQVLEYALTEMPSEKIMMGQNLYGYDWTLPFVQGTQAKALSPKQAVELARERNANILYDTTAQAPYFKYWLNGKEHVVWFEDARSIQAKFQLIKELGLRGISYWHIGFSFPQNWLLLYEMFKVKKR